MMDKTENSILQKEITFFPEWKTANPQFYPLIKDVRKNMRDNMTEAEKILWEELKSNKFGVKFRRQHIIDIFIPDFVALSCKLIIEVDGEIHNFQKEHDMDRTHLLNQKGFRVIRFTNNDIMHNLDEVLSKIREMVVICKTKV